MPGLYPVYFPKWSPIQELALNMIRQTEIEQQFEDLAELLS